MQTLTQSAKADLASYVLEDDYNTNARANRWWSPGATAPGQANLADEMLSATRVNEGFYTYAGTTPCASPTEDRFWVYILTTKGTKRTLWVNECSGTQYDVLQNKTGVWW